LIFESISSNAPLLFNQKSFDATLFMNKGNNNPFSYITKLILLIYLEKEKFNLLYFSNKNVDLLFPCD